MFHFRAAQVSTVCRGRIASVIVVITFVSCAQWGKRRSAGVVGRKGLDLANVFTHTEGERSREADASWVLLHL